MDPNNFDELFGDLFDVSFDHGFTPVNPEDFFENPIDTPVSPPVTTASPPVTTASPPVTTVSPQDLLLAPDSTGSSPAYQNVSSEIEKDPFPEGGFGSPSNDFVAHDFTSDIFDYGFDLPTAGKPNVGIGAASANELATGNQGLLSEFTHESFEFSPASGETIEPQVVGSYFDPESLGYRPAWTTDPAAVTASPIPTSGSIIKPTPASVKTPHTISPQPKKTTAAAPKKTTAAAPKKTTAAAPKKTTAAAPKKKWVSQLNREAARALKAKDIAASSSTTPKAKSATPSIPSTAMPSPPKSPPKPSPPPVRHSSSVRIDLTKDNMREKAPATSEVHYNQLKDSHKIYSDRAAMHPSIHSGGITEHESTYRFLCLTGRQIVIPEGQNGETAFTRGHWPRLNRAIYIHTPATSSYPNDITSGVPHEYGLSLNSSANVPLPIAWVDEPRIVLPHPQGLHPQILLTTNGTPELGTNGEPLRDLKILPRHISSAVEGWRMHYWLTLDKRITYADILARMHFKCTPTGGEGPFFEGSVKVIRMLKSRVDQFRRQSGVLAPLTEPFDPDTYEVTGADVVAVQRLTMAQLEYGTWWTVDEHLGIMYPPKPENGQAWRQERHLLPTRAGLSPRVQKILEVCEPRNQPVVKRSISAVDGAARQEAALKKFRGH